MRGLPEVYPTHGNPANRKTFRTCHASIFNVRALLFSLLVFLALPVLAQTPDLSQPARNWVVATAKAQIPIVTRDNLNLRYLSRRVNEHGDLVRDTIEAKEGAVARLVRKENRPLTKEEDDAERARLQATLKDPGSFLRHHKRDRSNIALTTELINVMPDAMIWTYVPGQPQLEGRTSRQVVLDFHPNPAFHASSMAQSALASLEGRIWIDATTNHMMHMEGRVFKDATLGWGLIARIYAGGKLELDQKDFGNGLWTYSRLTMDLNVREVLVHTVKVKSLFEATNMQQMPSALTWQDAIRVLLDTPLPK